MCASGSTAHMLLRQRMNVLTPVAPLGKLLHLIADDPSIVFDDRCRKVPFALEVKIEGALGEIGGLQDLSKARGIVTLPPE